MKRFSDLSLGNKIAVTFVIVLALLFALALYGYLTGAWERDDASGEVMSFALSSAETRPFRLHKEANAQEPELCMNAEMREKVRDIMLVALDEALKTHIENVFIVWLRDDAGQPGRARTGVKQGVSAYIRSRASMQKWDPPECKTQ